jgi:hypothetical protein
MIPCISKEVMNEPTYDRATVTFNFSNSLWAALATTYSSNKGLPPKLLTISATALLEQCMMPSISEIKALTTSFADKTLVLVRPGSL